MTRQKSITDKIREMILAREALPGERLQEVQLSERLGVSRTPVREALVVLEQEGLVTYRPNRGYVVRAFAMKDVLDAYLVRSTFEGLACRVVAEQGISIEGRQTLEECLAQGDEILSVGELVEEALPNWRTMNDRFHQTILAESNNAVLIDVASRTLAIPFLSSRVVHWHNYRRIYRSHEDHHATFDAICRRQGARAEATMREHIYIAIDVIASEYGDMFANSPEVEEVS
jgi:GntR family transcriptional regulator, vanillate catabolism transcriptional regulator